MDQGQLLENIENLPPHFFKMFRLCFLESMIHLLPIHDPLCIRIHCEYVYPSIIHHVSLSIILSRLRIHLEAPGRHFGDFLPTFWRFSADIADILVILVNVSAVAGILRICN